MTTPEGDSAFEFEWERLIVAAVIIAVGTLIAWVGVAIGTQHAWSQGSRWVRTVDKTPAKAKWQQLQKAAQAGAAASAEAWQKPVL